MKPLEGYGILYPESPVRPDLPLPEKTRKLIRRFEGERKDHGFDDGGDGTIYACWFADLLREWMEAGQ